MGKDGYCITGKKEEGEKEVKKSNNKDVKNKKVSQSKKNGDCCGCVQGAPVFCGAKFENQKR